MLDERQANDSLAKFRLRAEANVGKWGLQDKQTLGLAIAEGCGELAKAILKHRHEGGTLLYIMREATDLGALCIQIRQVVGEELMAELTDAPDN